MGIYIAMHARKILSTIVLTIQRPKKKRHEQGENKYLLFLVQNILRNKNKIGDKDRVQNYDSGK